MQALRRSFVLFLAAAALLGSAALARDGEGQIPAPGEYRVTGGNRVDAGTYAGWFAYHMTCHICHGQDAVGTDVAPDLRLSLRSMGPGEFATKLLARYRLFSPGSGTPADDATRKSVVDEVLGQRRGERGRLVMPVWPEDAGLRPHVLDLYAYLKARSDGALAPGRPEISIP